MKSFTDIEQSKKLAEILPPESVDHNYLRKVRNENAVDGEWNFFDTDYEIVPCWSLAALLNVLPEGVIENYYTPNIQKENGKYSVAYGNEELLCVADNAIDACVEMILKLHELKML